MQRIGLNFLVSHNLDKGKLKDHWALDSVIFSLFVWLFSIDILKLVKILCFSLLPTIPEPLGKRYYQGVVRGGNRDLFASRNDCLGELLGTYRASGAVLPCLSCLLLWCSPLLLCDSALPLLHGFSGVFRQVAALPDLILVYVSVWLLRRQQV